MSAILVPWWGVLLSMTADVTSAPGEPTTEATATIVPSGLIQSQGGPRRIVFTNDPATGIAGAPRIEVYGDAVYGVPGWTETYGLSTAINSAPTNLDPNVLNEPGLHPIALLPNAFARMVLARVSSWSFMPATTPCAAYLADWQFPYVCSAHIPAASKLAVPAGPSYPATVTIVPRDYPATGIWYPDDGVDGEHFDLLIQWTTGATATRYRHLGAFLADAQSRASAAGHDPSVFSPLAFVGWLP